ncbi:protein-L-isoaspartate O-methyltransferase [Kitasatospora sp. NPDC093558]|uniref:protein-L-isoaspartate O-methyltransferase family protein n=1 Tax=Kitasatospora sp. NPDC093558 TaxID=3155201 RepID=UPI003414A6C7
MTTTEPTTWQGAADRLVDDLRAKGAVRTEQVAAAIRAVPRHLFITGHYTGPDGRFTAVDPGESAEEFLALAYSDRGIMTHVPQDPARTHSSTSQPSIVAKMLEAADVSPGMRVLEIGAGTGWNSALIAAITGTEVLTVEHSEVVADEARTALSRAAVTNVRVHTGDGYHGLPGYRFDRIIVTCGIAGIAPAWFDQLTDTGFILAPLAHGGMHPITRIPLPGSGDEPTGQLVTIADFMTAAGPLYGDLRTSPATRSVTFPTPSGPLDAPFPTDLTRDTFADLCTYLAGHEPWVTCASTADGTYGGCAVVNADETAAVFIQPNGIHPSDDTPSTLDLAKATAKHVASWEHRGRPALQSWTCRLHPAGLADQPIWAPGSWTCG